MVVSKLLLRPFYRSGAVIIKSDIMQTIAELWLQSRLIHWRTYSRWSPRALSKVGCQILLSSLHTTGATPWETRKGEGEGVLIARSPFCLTIGECYICSAVMDNQYCCLIQELKWSANPGSKSLLKFDLLHAPHYIIIVQIFLVSYIPRTSA